MKALKEHEAYYPGTEDIAPDEMRITACGTGMPSARPKQAAACFLVELGNGDKFIFDIGSGSAERLSALAIPYDYLDKVFIGHLHSDHFGDLGDLWVGGVISNRQVPLRVWGPSGSKKEWGQRMRLSTWKRCWRGTRPRVWATSTHKVSYSMSQSSTTRVSTWSSMTKTASLYSRYRRSMRWTAR